MDSIAYIVLDDETLEVEDTKARTDIGDVTALKTNAKDTLVKAVNECFQSASDGKALIASAITGKGVNTDSGASFATMANNITAIKTNPMLQAKTATLGTAAQTIKADSGYDGLSQVTVPAIGGTAVVANVLAGKTFSSATGVNQTGTMVDRGAVTQSLNAGGSYTIPAGYHNGSGKVTANSLASQTSGTATAAQILNGQTAYVNGAKVTGTMTRKVPDYADQLTATGVNYGAGSGNSTEYLYCGITDKAYYDGVNYIRTTAKSIADAIDLQPWKIVSGNTVLGVAGTGGNKRYSRVVGAKPEGTSDLSLHPNCGYMSLSSGSPSQDRNRVCPSFRWASLTGGWIPSAVKVVMVVNTGSTVFTHTAFVTTGQKTVFWEQANVSSMGSHTACFITPSDKTGLANALACIMTDGITMGSGYALGLSNFTFTYTVECWE